MAKRVRRDAKAKHSTDGVLPWQHAVAAVGLILVSLAIYAQTASFEFTNWDDPMLIVENRAVRSLSPAAVADMFTPKPGQTFQPLRVLSYAVDYQLWGGYSARGIHLVNVLLHTLASLLLYGAIWSFLEADPGRRQAGGWLCAGLFLAHPVNVESVAWCASRKYGLLAVFCFASLWLFICGVRKSSNLPLLISSFVCFVLALLSSPFAIVLPPILMLILYTREPGLSPLPILTKYRAAWIPYVVAFLLAVPALAFLLVRSSDGGISTDYHTGSPMHTFLSMMRVFTDYLRNLAAPFWLNNRYPNRVNTNFTNWKISFSMLVIFGAFAASVWSTQRGNKHVLLCVGWFAICLGPVSNLIAISTLMADRYLYIASVGIFLGITLLCVRFLRTPQLWAVAAILVCGYACGAHQRTKVWRTSETLWADSLAKDRVNDIALNNMGTALKAQERHAESLIWYEKCLKLNPEYIDAYANLGAAYLQQGLYKQAIKPLLEAIKRKEDHDLAWYNLGVCFADQGKTDQALEAYGTAVKLQPENVKYLTNLGATLFSAKRFDAAATHYKAALRVEPGLPEAAANLANVYLMRRAPAKARLYYNMALAKSDLVEARLGLADVQVLEKDLPGAIASLNAIIAKHPTEKRAFQKLATLHRRNKDEAAAAKVFARLAQLNPRDLTALLALGDAALKANDTATAIGHYKAALAVQPKHPAANNILGLLAFQQQHYQDAIAHFQIALTARPAWVDPIHSLASCYFQTQDLVKAEELFRKTVSIKPDYGQAWTNLGATCLSAKKYDAAIEALQKALELQPDDSRTAQYLEHAKAKK